MKKIMFFLLTIICSTAYGQGKISKIGRYQFEIVDTYQRGGVNDYKFNEIEEGVYALMYSNPSGTIVYYLNDKLICTKSAIIFDDLEYYNEFINSIKTSPGCKQLDDKTYLINDGDLFIRGTDKIANGEKCFLFERL